MTPYRFALLLCLCTCMVAHGDELELANGDVLRGTVVERTDESVSFEHPILGVLTIPTAQVTAVRVGDAAGGQAPAKPAAPVVAKPEKPAEELLPKPKFLEPWKISLTLGIDGSEGNTRLFNIVSKLDARREVGPHRTIGSLAYFLGQEDGDETKNQFLADLKHDYTFTEKTFVFGLVGFKADRFEDYDSRVNLSAGLGRELIKTDSAELLARIGAGASREFGGTDDDWTPEALFGLEGRWQLDERQSIEGLVKYFPSLEDFGDYRVRARGEYKLRLMGNLSLSLGAENEYDSTAAGDSKRNDLTYFAALTLDW